MFTFCQEEGTPAGAMPDQVPAEVKEERRARVMALQQGISLKRNRAQVGRSLDVLIEGRGDGLSIGRSYRDAPEVDGMVLIQQELPTGQRIPVEITGAMEYDLLGRPVEPALAEAAELDLIPVGAIPTKHKRHARR